MNLIPLRITLCCCVLLAACGDDKTTPLPDASASGDTSGTADSLSDANDATSTGGDISSDAAQTGITQKDLCPLLAAKTCAALTACGCPFDSYGTTACVDVQRGRCEKSIVAYLETRSIPPTAGIDKRSRLRSTALPHKAVADGRHMESPG